MQDDLDAQLKRHYENQRLSADKIDDLVKVGRTRSRWILQAPRSWALGVIMVLAVAVALVMPESSIDRDVEMLSADIAKNHMAGRSDDIQIRDLSTIVVQLAEIGFDFELPVSRQLQGEIVGARLCSLAGKPAVHVYLDNDGRLHSLFVSVGNDSQPNLTGALPSLPDLDIQTWSEDGHFFALAQNR